MPAQLKNDAGIIGAAAIASTLAGRTCISDHANLTPQASRSLRLSASAARSRLRPGRAVEPRLLRPVARRIAARVRWRSRSSGRTARSRSSPPRFSQTRPRTMALTVRYVERLVKFLLWQRGGPTILIGRRAGSGGGAAAALPRRRASGPSTSNSWERKPIARRLRIEARATRRDAGGARNGHAARPAPRRLPHRLRSRRLRPQVRRGHRWRGRLHRGNRRGIRISRATRSITSTASTTRCSAPPRTCRAWTPSAAAPRAFM